MKKKGEAASLDTKKKKEDAAKASVVAAIKAKKMKETIEAMNKLKGCEGANKTEECFTNIINYKREKEWIVNYWANMVTNTGGPNNTKNRNEQTNLE